VTGNDIVGNPIGTNSSGSAAVPNQGDGVTDSAPANTIGGPGAGQANVISGNAGNGISITEDDNLVSVNRSGTNQAGTAALGNGNDGISITPDNNTVGAASALDIMEGTAPTVISGDNNAEIDLAGNDNPVANCYIGTDATGSYGLGNGGDGIDIEGSNNDIGLCFAPGPALPNPTVISGREGTGLTPNGAKNTISNCYIGLDKTGSKAVPNQGSGITLGTV